MKQQIFDSLNNTYKNEGMDISFLSSLNYLAKKMAIHPYSIYLEYLKSALPILKEKFIEKGIPLNIYEDTIKDIEYKRNECLLVYGVDGIVPFEWYCNLFNVGILAFGRLQFQILTLKEDIDSKNISLQKGDTVISVHIPKDGTRLEYDKVQESYKLAEDFFIKKYGLIKPIVFMLSSWLLDPIIKEFLPATSNILRFTSDYTLVSSGLDGNYKEIWRLFDKNYTGDFSSLPSDTTLRRKYIESFKNGRTFGHGLGFYYYNK